jgi:hypothetical protein
MMAQPLKDTYMLTNTFAVLVLLRILKESV